MDEDFETPLANAIKDLVKNDEVLRNLKIAYSGIQFDTIDLNRIKFKELKTILYQILNGIITTGYNLMGPKPVNKIIGQLGPTIAIKSTEIRDLGICYEILELVVKVLNI